MAETTASFSFSEQEGTGNCAGQHEHYTRTVFCSFSWVRDNEPMGNQCVVNMEREAYAELFGA